MKEKNKSWLVHLHAVMSIIFGAVENLHLVS